MLLRTPSQARQKPVNLTAKTCRAVTLCLLQSSKGNLTPHGKVTSQLLYIVILDFISPHYTVWPEVRGHALSLSWDDFQTLVYNEGKP